jgi:RNA 2',3'-cyclic 3'-phosphodiesterase
VSGALRLFCALELPPAAIAALESFRDAAADPDVWRPVPATSMHVTIAFLGATDPALVDPLAAALGEAVGPDPEAPWLALSSALLLPSRRPRALCTALDDAGGALAALQSRVSDALARTGAHAPEERRFRAHVTVARLRPRARAPRSVDAAPEPIEFAATAVTLFSSRTAPEGARHEPLVSFPLRTGRIDD